MNPHEVYEPFVSPPPPDSAAPSPQPLKNQPPTWLPGIFFTFILSLLTVAASVNRHGSMDRDIGYCAAALVVFGALLGYAGKTDMVIWAVLYCPWAAGVGILLASVDGGLDTAVYGIVAGCIALPPFVKWLLFRPLLQKPAVLVPMIAGLIGLPVLFAPEPFKYIAPLVLIGWISYAMVCAFCLALGGMFRDIYYWFSDRKTEGLPDRLVPRQFALWDMFKWTAWMALISTIFRALQLPVKIWVQGTFITAVAGGAAYLVVRQNAHRPRKIVMTPVPPTDGESRDLPFEIPDEPAEEEIVGHTHDVSSPTSNPNKRNEIPLGLEVPMNLIDLFPYVVPKDYLHIPGGGKQPSLDKWGIVEPIGPDLFRMLIDASGGMVRNVHEENLAELGLSVVEGKAKAIDNLRAMVEGGENFQRQLSMSEDGLGHIVWMGHWLAASCIVLPELHGWASKHLKTDEMLVSVPQQQFMFLFSVGDAEFRRDMRSYIKKVVEGMEKLITFDLFLLSERGLEPYTEPHGG